MYISSAVSPASVSGLKNKATAPINNSVRAVTPEIVPEQSSSKPIKANVIIDEQAIALVHQRLKSTNDTLASAQFATNQDQSLAKNETAAASYQTIANLAQRESVQQLLGVDLFA